MSELIIREASAAQRDEAAALLTPAQRPLFDQSCGEHEQLLAALQHDAVVGCVRVRRAIGRDAPRYWYHVGRVVHAAPELGLFHEQRTLLLNNDLTGATEIADLGCDPSLDAPAQLRLLRLLVRAAVLRVASAAHGASPPELIAELPGMRDAAGRAPFWNSLGQHFYAGDPQQTAERFGPVWRSHVAALLPRDPLVASFLTPEAQDAIGEVHHEVGLRLQALTLEGFRHGRYVTIDDAGPVLEAWLDGSATPKPQRWVLQAGRPDRGGAWLVASEAGVALIEASAQDDMLVVAPEALQRLALDPGAPVWAFKA